MSDQCIVSIIVPIYNAENYIDICIRSLVTQTYNNIEIILVDDCSTDRSLEMCKNWSSKDERIRVFSLEKNSGPSTARNKGLQEAQGEYITFVDSDDWVEKECVEDAIEIAKKSGVDVLIWNLINRYEKSETLEKSLKGEERFFIGNDIKYLQEMILTSKSETGTTMIELFGPTAKLFRADTLREVYFPEGINISEDACFTIQVLSKAQKVQYINRTYYHRTIRGDSLSYKHDDMYYVRRLRFVNWMLAYCKRMEIVSERQLNQFLYQNLILVVQHHMRALPRKDQAETYTKIREFLNGLEMPIDWDVVEDDNGRRKKFLRKGWYWRYKMWFVFENIMRAKKQNE